MPLTIAIPVEKITGSKDLTYDSGKIIENIREWVSIPFHLSY